MAFDLKVKIYLEIFVILVLLTLIIGIISVSSKLSCDDCKVTFRTVAQLGNDDLKSEINTNSTFLYESLKNNSCPIYFSRTEGYKWKN